MSLDSGLVLGRGGYPASERIEGLFRRSLVVHMADVHFVDKSCI